MPVDIAEELQLLQCCCVLMQGVARLVQNAADAEEDDDEEEDEVPVKPSLHRPGKRGGRGVGAVSFSPQKNHCYVLSSLHTTR